MANGKIRIIRDEDELTLTGLQLRDWKAMIQNETLSKIEVLIKDDHNSREDILKKIEELKA